MCGIIGATSSRSVGKILIKGLHLMEYRGYDSAGVALQQKDQITRLRALGKVAELESLMVKHKPKAKDAKPKPKAEAHILKLKL